ncbi:MAG: hypothetical protein ACOY35_11605 [Bacillota bacterium]
MGKRKFKVTWSAEAIEGIGQLFNVNARQVIRNSKHILSNNPYSSAFGIANFPGYEFNGYFWIYINNVILIYNVKSDYKLVSIEACYSALTGEVAEIFYGISPDG